MYSLQPVCDDLHWNRAGALHKEVVMDVVWLTNFFGWMTLINLGLFVVWVGAWMAAPDMVYQTQTRLFDIPRQRFEVMFYGF